MAHADTPSVWIDTDLGFDDLAAVLTVAAQPQWQIDGMSLVAGNAPLAVVIDNAQRAADCFDWCFPIHSGCARPLACALVTAQDILGEDALRSAGRSLPLTRRALASDDAVTALARYLEQRTTPATVLALGPLTNIATVLQRHPELAPRIADLVWMGGSAGPGNHTATAEFNAAVDPESVQQVLDQHVPLRMVGLDACRQVRVHASDALALRSIGTLRAALLADLLLGYVQIASPDRSRPMALYDPCAAAALVAPATMEFRPAHLVMELQGIHTRGMTVVEWRVPRRAAPNAMVAGTADEHRVRETVLQALAHAARRR